MALKKATILIVDDEDAARTVLSWKLEDAGYIVGIATEPQSAVEEIRSHHYDLVLLDIMMPGNGIAFFEKALTEFPDTPIICMTSYGGSDKAIEAMRLGARDYLLKPIVFEELLLRIERVLKKYKASKLLIEIQQHLVEANFTLGTLRSEQYNNIDSEVLAAINRAIEAVDNAQDKITIITL